MRKVVLLLCVAMPLASASPALPSSLSSSSIEDHDAAWATLHSAFRRLQAAVSPDSKEGVSIWTSAKRFFGSRERIKSKLSGAPAATSMPKDFGLGYKHMLEWYCAKAEKKGSTLCQKPTPTATTFSAKPSVTEQAAAVKAYCTEAAHKDKPLCVASRIRRTPTPPSTDARLAAAAGGLQAAAAPRAPTSPTGKAKKLAKVSSVSPQAKKVSSVSPQAKKAKKALVKASQS